MNQYHQPVLLKKVLDFLEPKAGKLYIDATIGGAGHALEIVKLGARVLGIDRDPEAIAHIKKKVKSQKSKVKSLEDLVLVQGNFSHIREIANKYGFNKVDGILFDLGVSSHQLETARRGFSFKKSGPLDMRMDPNIKITASDIVNNFDKRRLNEIFKDYAHEKFSWSVANAILRARQIEPITTTGELAQIVEKAVTRAEYKTFELIKGNKRTKSKGLHPATKVFQALRIVVNSELLNLQSTLPQTIDLLKLDGKLVVISFHSLEDGFVKRFFKQNKNLKILTKKPVSPSLEEVRQNPRARSARLRAAKRV